MRYEPHGQEGHPQAYPISDACRRLGIGRTKYYELRKAGKIKPVRIGGRDKVPDQELRRLLKEGA
jgi:excisionase family DNA binding protein